MFMIVFCTCQYLESVHPLLDGDQYQQMAILAKDFKNSKAAQLQRYLILKSWWATNYVSSFHRRHLSLGENLVQL